MKEVGSGSELGSESVEKEPEAETRGMLIKQIFELKEPVPLAVYVLL